MAETEAPSPSVPEAELLAKLEKLETAIQANEQLRQRTRWYSLVGMLLILVLVLVFVWRIVDHFQTQYYRPIQEDPTALVEQVMENVEWERVLQAESQAAQAEFRRVSEDFAARVYDRMLERMPEIEDEFLAVGDELNVYAQAHVEAQLTEAFIDSLDEMRDELAKEFPEFVEDDWDEHLEEAKQYFMVQLADSLEERIGRVSAKLEALKDAAATVAESEGSEDVKAMSRGELEEALINTMIDLAYYEMRPEKGNVPAAKGGER